MTHVNEESHSFYLPPTRISTSEMNHHYFPAAGLEFCLAGTHFSLH